MVVWSWPAAPGICERRGRSAPAVIGSESLNAHRNGRSNADRPSHAARLAGAAGSSGGSAPAAGTGGRPPCRCRRGTARRRRRRSPRRARWRSRPSRCRRRGSSGVSCEYCCHIRNASPGSRSPVGRKVLAATTRAKRSGCSPTRRRPISPPQSWHDQRDAGEVELVEQGGRASTRRGARTCTRCAAAACRSGRSRPGRGRRTGARPPPAAGSACGTGSPTTARRAAAAPGSAAGRALVDVVDPERVARAVAGVDLHVAGLVRPAGQVGEALVRGPQRFHPRTLSHRLPTIAIDGGSARRSTRRPGARHRGRHAARVLGRRRPTARSSSSTTSSPSSGCCPTARARPHLRRRRPGPGPPRGRPLRQRRVPHRATACCRPRSARRPRSRPPASSPRCSCRRCPARRCARPPGAERDQALFFDRMDRRLPCGLSAATTSPCTSTSTSSTAPGAPTSTSAASRASPPRRATPPSCSTASSLGRARRRGRTTPRRSSST